MFEIANEEEFLSIQFLVVDTLLYSQYFLYSSFTQGGQDGHDILADLLLNKKDRTG